MKNRSISKIKSAYESEGVTSLSKEETLKLIASIEADYAAKFKACMKNGLPYEDFEKLEAEMAELQKPLIEWYKIKKEVEEKSLEELISYFS